MTEGVVFASTCPVCNHERVQCGFSIASLHRLLRGAHPIEAYCERCDEFWPLGVQERIQLGDIVAFWSAAIRGE